MRVAEQPKDLIPLASGIHPPSNQPPRGIQASPANEHRSVWRTPSTIGRQPQIRDERVVVGADIGTALKVLDAERAAHEDVVDRD